MWRALQQICPLRTDNEHVVVKSVTMGMQAPSRWLRNQMTSISLDKKDRDNPMTDSLVQAEIDRVLESLDGELTSHSRVIDALLDLRSASDDVRLVAVIDESLRNVPGRNAVSTDWWKTQLKSFRLMADEQPVN